MRGLRLSGLLLSCIASAVLLTAGAMLCALAPWNPTLVWMAALVFWVAMWVRR
jgi:hypothetical protein